MKLTTISKSLKLAILAMSTSSAALADTSLPTFDWQPNANCANGLCCGAFIAPTNHNPDATIAPELAATRIGAGQMFGDDSQMTLLDQVEFIQGWRSATAEKAVYNHDAETAELSGNIFLREPGFAVSGQRAFVDNRQMTSSIEQGQFVLHAVGASGAANKVQFSDGDLTLNDLVFTTCSPLQPDWMLNGEELIIDSEKGQGTGRNLSLKVKGNTVFWWPYLRFPVGDKRLSGLLWPRIGLSDADGFEYAQPYYINLAPNYDATIAPHWFSKRGLLINGEFRHLGEYGHTELSGGYLDDDVTGTTRWLRQAKHQGHFGERVTTRVNWAQTSDENYLRDLRSEGLSVNKDAALAQYAYIDLRLADHWSTSVFSEHYQSLHIGAREEHRIEPQIDLNGFYQWQHGAWQTDLNLDHSHTQFTHGAQTLGEILQYGYADQGDRTHIQYSLSSSYLAQWGYMRAGIEARYLSFDIDSRPAFHAYREYADKQQSVSEPTVFTEGSMVFERPIKLSKLSLLNTLEPRVFYYNTGYEAQWGAPVFNTVSRTVGYDSLFSQYRTSGDDRIDDGERISFGLTSRFIDAQTGLEKLTLSIGQGFWADNRYAALNPLLTQDIIDRNDPTGLPSDAREELHQLTRSRSNIEIEASTQLSKHWYLKTATGYDTERNISEHSHIMAWYTGKQRQLVSMSAAQRHIPASADKVTGLIRDRDVSQASLGTVWPINGQYKLIANVTHDFTNERLLDSLVGVGYESCCWQASIGYREWVDNRLNNEVELQEKKRGIVLQFSLKGLGGSRQIDNSLYKSMYGYEQNFKALF